MTVQSPQKVQSRQPTEAPVSAETRNMTPDQAADKLAGIIKAGNGHEQLQKKQPQQQKQPKQQKQPPKAEPQPKQEEEKVDILGGTADEDIQEDQIVSDTDDEEADAEEGHAESEEGDDQEETLYTVKVNGKEEKVPLSELLKGYSRAKDYYQKTEALAKERKEVETLKESAKDLPQQREAYVKGAERFSHSAVLMLQAMQQKFMPQPPNPELAKTDPAAYWAAKEAHQDALQFTGALQQELGTIRQKLDEQAKSEHAKAVQESRKKLYEAMPEMAQAPARQKLREYANSLGFTDEQIAREANHVLFVCVEKARRWDELQAQKNNVKPQAKLPKVTPRTNANETKRAVDDRKKQAVLSEHRQKGTISSAERALAAIINGQGK